MEQIEKRTNEATSLVYRTKVRKWKKKGQFTEERQEEAMQDVINRVHKFQPNADDELIRMLSEQRLLQIRAQMKKANSSAK